jgi:hypothetical protein
MGKLVLFLADGSALDIPLDRERVMVGRRPGNEVCLPYAAVSGAHAVFVTTPTGVVIEDLGSTNGTMINGKRTLRQVVHDGDRIEIGRQQLVYLADVNAVVSPLTRRAPGGARSRGARSGGERGGPAMDSATASPGVVPAASPREFPPPPMPADAFTRAVPAAPAFAGPILKVLAGPSAGQTLALTRDEALIGRVGLQVVAVRKADNAYRLVFAEGAGAPLVNGAPVPPEGVLLQPDDAIEVAGVQLVFLEDGGVLSSGFLPPRDPSRNPVDGDVRDDGADLEFRVPAK